MKVTIPDPPDEYEKVNRLVIIGNGFDLAHGLKSSFKDFIDDYFYNLIHRLVDNSLFEDELIRINASSKTLEILRAYDGLTKGIAHKKFRELIAEIPESSYWWKSPFFKAIVEHSEIYNWVDIEIKYFEHLSKASQDTSNTILKLNSDLQIIKEKLCEYLKGEVKKSCSDVSYDLLAQFEQDLKLREAKTGTIKRDMPVSSIFLLNFNYTSLAEMYIYRIQLHPNKCIPIHGELIGDDFRDQGPVFGFGDELDKEYLKFEDMGNDELFKHIKSFKYLQFNNYRSLLEFIEAFPFQVHIYGHSCGLSDRTLLNTIFEHENCISIKPFYYAWEGGDDYEQKSFAISRHFKSKIELRAKVVNKKYCEPMVQPRH